MMMWSITRRKNARRGFTLVELLAVIVILGILSMIGIASVSKLISKSKQTYLEQQEKNISMAAESYLQANTNAKPKSIGDSVNLSIKDLKSSNYLKEDITNSNGDSCMSNSFVRVYKYSKSEYSYTAYLYCGDDEVPDTIEVPSPTISVLLTDSSGNKNDQAVFDNVKSAVLKINMTGGSINDGSLVAIDGYYFSISTKSSASDEYTEVYNSGTLSANGKDSLSVNKTIGDYVNLTGDTYVSIKVVVTNVSGGKTEKNITTSDKNSEAIYNDKKAPECGEGENITGAAEDENDWINKKDAEKGTNNSRTISIGCSDGEGSGCLRNKFTKTWPNKNTTDAEYSYITIKDNNGNTTDCRVRVNVDSTSPTISVNAYKATSSGGTTGNNVLTNTVKASDKNNSVEILATQYNNVAGGSWLNNANYPYGIIYSFNVSDNLHLYRWTWETNAGYINTAADGNYTTTSSSNPDSASGYFDNSKIDFTTANNGLTSSKVNVSF
jgi:prepilin-type N-terminal cleavage/methylation domain-containing protein